MRPPPNAWFRNGILIALLGFLPAGCARGPRGHYSRSTGDYVAPAPRPSRAAVTAPAVMPVASVQAKAEAAGSVVEAGGTEPEIRTVAPESTAAFAPVRGDGDRIVKAAAGYIGVRYRWAGQTPVGFDCSGLVKRVYEDAVGLKLPHSSRGLAKLGQAVSRDDLQAGDVVLFGSRWGINHAGIYAGNGRFIHASPQVGVEETELDQEYFVKRYRCARRLL